MDCQCKEIYGGNEMSHTPGPWTLDKEDGDWKLRVTKEINELIESHNALLSRVDAFTGEQDELTQLRERVAELEEDNENLESQLYYQTYKGNSIGYIHEKMVAYGGVCKEVNEILECPGVDIRDAAKDLKQQLAELKTQKNIEKGMYLGELRNEIDLLKKQLAKKDKVIKVLADEIKKHVHPVTVGGNYHNDNEPWTWWKEWAEQQAKGGE
jgi:DNA repair exonuclease SbcCD ATPase subunit